MRPGSRYFKCGASKGWAGWRRRLAKRLPLTAVSFCIYLEEGSRLWIAVINRRTMNAHTKLDLNTSSLI